jgi:hypothetical protein
MMEYLIDAGCPTSGACREAEDAGNYNMIRWLLERGVVWTPRLSMAIGGLYGHTATCTVELLQWIMQQPGVKLEARALHAAAEAGLLDVCQFLRAQGCPWVDPEERYPPNALDAAALNGHAAVARWLHESGAPVREWPFPCYHAAESGSIETMRYLLSIGLPVSADTLSVMLAAAGARDQLAAAQWLRQQGAPWPEEYLMFVDGNSAQNWSDEAVAWARSEGCTVPLLPAHLQFS